MNDGWFCLVSKRIHDETVGLSLCPARAPDTNKGQSWSFNKQQKMSACCGMRMRLALARLRVAMRRALRFMCVCICLVHLGRFVNGRVAVAMLPCSTQTHLNILMNVHDRRKHLCAHMPAWRCSPSSPCMQGYLLLDLSTPVIVFSLFKLWFFVCTRATTSNFK